MMMLSAIILKINLFKKIIVGEQQALLGFVKQERLAEEQKREAPISRGIVVQ